MSAVVDRKPAVTSGRLELAARVAELRALGMTHAKVAATLGISRGYASCLATDPDGSEQFARRARYQGTCLRCGAATDGSNGRAKAPEHCSVCSELIQHENRRWTAEAVIEAIRRWNDEAVIEAIRRWNDEHGRPPRATDWQKTDRPAWAPTLNAVARYGGWKNAPFASWADAIEAAGFPRPLVGKREGDRHWSRELILEELHARAVDGFVSSAPPDGFSTIAAYYFGSWSAACAAAGLRPASERRAREPEAASPHKEKGSSVGSR